jgi:tRNA A37 threonylcarbamoyladenosine dehydratase
MNKNIGWLSKEDQKSINKATIAIGGCGGVGGRCAEMAARIGFENINPFYGFSFFSAKNYLRW